MKYVSEGILEAAWLTVDRGGCLLPETDPDDNVAAWISFFASEVNDRLPDGVELDTEHCMQTGCSAAFVSKARFAEILDQAEHETDKAAFMRHAV